MPKQFLVFLGLTSSKQRILHLGQGYNKILYLQQSWVTKQHDHVTTVILLGILGNYLFLSIWDFFSIKIGKISAKIHEMGKIKAIFGLGMTPI